MTLLEAETLAAAYVALNIPARAFSPPGRPGYAVLVRMPGREPWTLYDNPLVAQALLNVPSALISEPADVEAGGEAADPTLVLHPGDDAGGPGLPDPGGDSETDPALEKLLAHLRREPGPVEE